MASFKTPVTVLQELMVKLGEVPEYQCVAQTGPQHLSMFEYECAARGLRVRATARSKKEAKQEVARAMLAKLHKALPAPSSSLGHSSILPDPSSITAPPEPESKVSYVALLTEMCAQYGLPAAEYTLIGDTGPPHRRQFTVQASLGQAGRRGSANTKKAARQQAAHDLYRYLRENLSSLTSGFDETEALQRVHEKVMERYVEVKGAAPARDLSRRLDDCPRNMFAELDDEKRAEILAIIEDPSLEPEQAAMSAARVAGLRGEWAGGGGGAGGGAVLRLGGALPALAVAGAGRGQAAVSALRLLRLALN